MKKALLIINLGTPDHDDIKSVRRYLREFLSDRRVIQLPAILRFILLYGFILPFRAPKTLHAYQAIWTKHGSPLLYHSQQLLKKLQARLSNVDVALGMRYGHPSIEDALEKLAHATEITVLPLYPQYSSAANGSSLEKTLKLLASKPLVPSVRVIRDFYQHPAFIEASAALIKPYLNQHDFLLFSYHGLPEYHLAQTGCDQICPNECVHMRAHCYRSQCFQTSAKIAAALGLEKDQYATAFQSRLGKTPWIKPYTEHILHDLAQQGVQRLAVACPSFVADCLETIEEIGIRLKAQWHSLGNNSFTLIPSLNSNDEWVEAISKITTNE